MWLLEQWAERHILNAQANGEFDSLPGSGKPIVLDDDSHVPSELRAGFRLLKNSGCLPVELEYRKEAIALSDLLLQIQIDHPDYQAITRRLALLELKLSQVGLSAEFLRNEYASRIFEKIKEN